MPQDTCKLDSCPDPADGRRGWCNVHYRRNLRNGDPGPVAKLRSPVPCVAPECDRQSETSYTDLCRRHRRRQKRDGDPVSGRVRRLPEQDPETYFWTLVDKSGPMPDERPELGPCWMWRGNTNGVGYGTYGFRRRSYGAHVASLIFSKGFTPAKRDRVDHLCRRPLCVNPDHLEPVTNRENTLRGRSPFAVKAKKNACQYGHELAVRPRTVGGPDRRYCPTCARDHQRRMRKAYRFQVDKSSATALTEELLREVARIFEGALGRGDPPAVAVARHFQRPYATVQYWIRRARDRGILSPELRRGCSQPKKYPTGEVVYFVERDGFVKIGTTKRLIRRIGALIEGSSRIRGLSPGPVRLLGVLLGGRDLERELHERFAHRRVSGEWFWPDEELSALIKTAKVG